LAFVDNPLQLLEITIMTMVNSKAKINGGALYLNAASALKI
jgi:hypothetical protein